MPRSGLDAVAGHVAGGDAPFLERVLVLGVAAGLAAATLVAAGDWTLLQTAVAVVVALDLGGSVTAAATAPRSDAATGSVRRLASAAGNVHPFALSVVFTPLDPLYGGVVYVFVVLAVLLVVYVPATLRPGVALAGVVAAAALDAVLVATPPALDWFVPVYALALLASFVGRADPRSEAVDA